MQHVDERSYADPTDRVEIQCAWCRRSLVAGEWVEVEHVPEPVSHGMCPDCLAGLRAAG